MKKYLNACFLFIVFFFLGNCGGGGDPKDPVVYYKWTQVGTGFSSQEQKGYFFADTSMSDNGSIVAMGAPFSQDAKGQVDVYRFDGSEWFRVGNVIQGLHESDKLGASVALSGQGNRLAVGVPGYGSKKGEARVYSFNGVAWSQLGNSINGSEHLGEDPIVIGDEFGSVLALSGDGTMLAVGSSKHNSSTGQVRIFEFNSSSNTWVPLGDVLKGVLSGDEFGLSLSFSTKNNYLIIGSPGAANGKGEVYVYNLVANTWVLFAGTIRGEQDLERLGVAVAMLEGDSNHTVFAGAPDKDCVRIKTVDMSGSITASGKKQYDIGSGGGYAISCNNNKILAIGAPGKNIVYIEKYENSLEEDDNIEVSQGYFGRSVSLARDEDKMAILASNHTLEINNGFMRVYERKIKTLAVEKTLYDLYKQAVLSHHKSNSTSANSPGGCSQSVCNSVSLQSLQQHLLQKSHNFQISNKIVNKLIIELISDLGDTTFTVQGLNQPEGTTFTTKNLEGTVERIPSESTLSYRFIQSINTQVSGTLKNIFGDIISTTVLLSNATIDIVNILGKLQENTLLADDIVGGIIKSGDIRIIQKNLISDTDQTTYLLEEIIGFPSFEQGATFTCSGFNTASEITGGKINTDLTRITEATVRNIDQLLIGTLVIPTGQYAGTYPDTVLTNITISNGIIEGSTVGDLFSGTNILSGIISSATFAAEDCE